MDALGITVPYYVYGLYLSVFVSSLLHGPSRLCIALYMVLGFLMGLIIDIVICLLIECIGEYIDLDFLLLIKLVKGYNMLKYAYFFIFL